MSYSDSVLAMCLNRYLVKHVKSTMFYRISYSLIIIIFFGAWLGTEERDKVQDDIMDYIIQTTFIMASP